LGGQLGTLQNTQRAGGTDYKTSSLFFNASVGKAFKDNQVFGVTIGYGGLRQPGYSYGPDTVHSRNDRYNVGVFYRVYKPLGKGFYFFGEAAVGYYGGVESDHWVVAAGDVKTTTHGFGLVITPGFSYQVLKKLQVELTMPGVFNLSYNTYRVKSGVPNVADNSSSQFGVSTSVASSGLLNNIGVGLRLVL
jgi:hypothetical protein